MESTLGEVITFYSYKGGTGRSMALANVACLLAQKPKVGGDVLMIDWDLEAPGLHQFFHGRFNNTHDEQGDLSLGQLGLIDLFYEIRNRLEKSKSQDNISDDIFSEIDIQKYIVKVNRPSLFLMPAGKFDDGLYSTRVNEFNWADFFSKFPSVITQFAQYLRKKFKYVLIDSRTGYTDISGICTSIMPEKLVAIFTPNRQSLSGIVELIRRATDYRKQSDDLRPLMIFPLPSRIENAESGLKKEWRFGNSHHEGYQPKLASVLMDVYSLQRCDLTKYFDEYLLQYIPRYSYGEELAVLSERSEERLSLARSFENFTERIIGFENPWEEIADSLYEREKDRGETSKLPEPINSSITRTLLRVSMFVLGAVFIVWMYSVISPLIQSQQFLYQLFQWKYFSVFVIMYLVIDLIWVSRWKFLLNRINKLIAKPSVFEKDKEPFEPPLYPRSFLEQMAISVRRQSKSETEFRIDSEDRDDALDKWSRNIRNLVFDREKPIRTLGYVLALVFFIFFLFADANLIANTLVLMGLISSNLPPVLQRFDIAIQGGGLLSAIYLRRIINGIFHRKKIGMDIDASDKIYRRGNCSVDIRKCLP